MNSAGTMAKYFATSLAMENVVSVPRVISNCLPISTISISLVGSLSRSTMLPASLAACVPLFIATPTSACARAGASFVPSPIMATSLPPRCSRRMYSSLSSGLASAIKSSTPAFSAIYFAVRGLSPVTITVLTPILRRRSKRSRIPVLMISCNSMTPMTRSFSQTTSGVPPFSEIRHTVLSIVSGYSLPASVTIRRMVSDAPLRMRTPSGMSTPEHFVSAVKFTIRTPTNCIGSIRTPLSAPSSTIDLPSGVWSAIDESTHKRTNSPASIPSAG